jgi:hypothetical protein
LSAPRPHGRASPPFVTGLFADSKQAQEAFDRLVESTFDPHEISLLQVDDLDHSVERVPVEHKSGVPYGVGTGVALGTTVGIASAVIGGPVGLLAAGPILAALQGAVIGAAGGGVLGALAGLAFWWDEPELEAELRKGAVFVGVTAEGARADAARQALLAAGAARIFG